MAAASVLWRRLSSIGMVAILAVADRGWAQPPSQQLSFDIASVRENKSCQSANGCDKLASNVPMGTSNLYVPTGGTFTATNYPLVTLIIFAYKVERSQYPPLTKSLPGWVRTERIDVKAKTDKRDATKDDMRLMMRSLLAERFGLVIHSEKQLVKVSGLALAKPDKLGPGMRLHPTDDPTCSKEPPTELNPAHTLAAQTVAGRDPKKPGGLLTECGYVGGVVMETPSHRLLAGRDVGMDLMAEEFTTMAQLDHPVVDRTGLTGKFDFVLDYYVEPPASASAPVNAEQEGPTLSEAMRDQLGLKIEPVKEPVERDFWVVDRIDHPTEN